MTTVAFLLAGPVGAQSLLGSAQSFALLGGAAVTNVTTGTPSVSGDVGVSPGASLTGLSDGIGGEVVNGVLHSADGTSSAAMASAVTAYGALSGAAMTQNLTGHDLGTTGYDLLTPGVYRFDSTAQLTGTLTLDFAGHEDESFIFQVGSALTTASNAQVNVVNGSALSGVYWQVVSSATLGSGTTFAGNIVANTSISLAPGADILSGRAIAINGAVTLAGDNFITNDASVENFGNALRPDFGSYGYSGGPVSAVPEPSLALLFASGLAGLAFLRSRRQDASSDF